MDELREGVRLSRLFWPDGVVTPLRDDITQMMVVMQPGQGARVPWVKISYDNGKVLLYNCAWFAGVELQPITTESPQPKEVEIDEKGN